MDWSGRLRRGALDGERERVRLRLSVPAGGGEEENDRRERRDNDGSGERWSEVRRDAGDEGKERGVSLRSQLLPPWSCLGVGVL